MAVGGDLVSFLSSGVPPLFLFGVGSLVSIHCPPTSKNTAGQVLKINFVVTLSATERLVFVCSSVLDLFWISFVRKTPLFGCDGV